MTTITSPSLDTINPAPHSHLGFSGIYAVFAERFRVRRETVALHLTHAEYLRVRSLQRLAKKLKNEFDGTIEVTLHKTVSTSGPSRYVIEVTALPLEP